MSDMTTYEVPLVAYIKATVEADHPEDALYKAVNGVWINIGSNRNVLDVVESGPIDCIDPDKVWDQYDEPEEDN